MLNMQISIILPLKKYNKVSYYNFWTAPLNNRTFKIPNEKRFFLTIPQY